MVASVKSFLKRHLPEEAQHLLRRAVSWPPIIDFPPDLRRTVFLASPGRSGSGWVANIINYKNDYRYMYEPFNPVQQVVSPGFSMGRYLRPDDRDPALLKVARRLLTGGVGYNKLVDVDNKRFIASRRLIKEVSANLWLKWLHANFPGVKIVLLFRHPCAVVCSRIRHNNPVYLKPYLDQPDLMADFLAPFKSELDRANAGDEWDQRMFAWCIQHYVPLKQFAKGEIHLAFYENFAENPKEEIVRLFSFLGKKFDDEVFAAIKRPSFVTRSGAPILTGQSVVASWKKDMTEQRTRRALEITSLFGLEKIYGADPMPNTAAAYAQIR